MSKNASRWKSGLRTVSARSDGDGWYVDDRSTFSMSRRPSTASAMSDNRPHQNAVCIDASSSLLSYSVLIWPK